jgi:hypothetical protein
MRRFVPPRSRLPHEARWPDIERPRPRTPFSRRPDLEALSVVIDSELIDGLDEREPTRELLLAGLLSHEFVQVRRYSDSGPPADAPRHSSLRSPDAVEGWVVVTEFDAEASGWGVRSVEGDSVLETGIGFDIPRTAERDTADECYAELGETAAAEQRLCDVIAAQATEAIDADMFITERPYLRTTKLPAADGVLIATPLEALPVVSLYLRGQDQFIGLRGADGRFTMSLTRGMFYSRAGVELVPHGWTVLRALAEHAQGGGDRRMFELAQTVFGRLQQTLVARDGMYWALNRPQNNDTAEEALSAFDLALLTLMGAVDASARIAQRLLDVRSSDPSWLNERWRKRVGEASASLDAVFRDGCPHLHALRVLAVLRNSIHAAQIDPLALSISWGKVTTVIELGADRATRLRSAMNNLGGPAAWGVDRHATGRDYADPAQLFDELITRITAMLDALMAAMPITELSGVNQANQAGRPVRLFRESDVPSESLLWQLGLDARPE